MHSPGTVDRRPHRALDGAAQTGSFEDRKARGRRTARRRDLCTDLQGFDAVVETSGSCNEGAAGPDERIGAGNSVLDGAINEGFDRKQQPRGARGSDRRDRVQLLLIDDDLDGADDTKDALQARAVAGGVVGGAEAYGRRRHAAQRADVRHCPRNGAHRGEL